VPWNPESAKLSMMRRVLEFFGLVGEAPPQPKWWAFFFELTPILVSVIAALLDGATGWGGAGLWFLYLLVAWSVWLPIAIRFAPWRSGPDE
jgi:hypothetical protein